MVPARAREASAHWDKWVAYCAEIRLDPTLQGIQDHPIPFLQVFAYRYRHGQINTSRRQVRSRTVENALRSIGQTLATLGSPDPRYTVTGKIDFRLQRMLAAYTRLDPPPNRVKPVPIPVLQHIMHQAVRSQAVPDLAFADMLCLAFFFLLRPGEYTGTVSDTQPFLLQDLTLYLGTQRLSPMTAPLEHIRAATFVTLEFTTQKNAVRGEVIGLARSGDPYFCPVTAAARRVTHLRQCQAPPHQPIASSQHPITHRLHRITSNDLTQTLRQAAIVLGATYGFLPHHVSARSLRASGAMALLCANVDTDRIQLIGRWRSDEMLRYLHVQAEPVMRNFAARMLQGGHFSLLPNHDVPLL